MTTYMGEPEMTSQGRGPPLAQVKYGKIGRILKFGAPKNGSFGTLDSELGPQPFSEAGDGKEAGNTNQRFEK